MAAAGEKTLAHSELKRSLIGAFHAKFIRALSLVNSFQNKDGGALIDFEGFVETEKCFLQSLRPKRWTEFRSDCFENCDCTVGRQTFADLILASVGVQRVLRYPRSSFSQTSTASCIYKCVRYNLKL